MKVSEMRGLVVGGSREAWGGARGTGRNGGAQAGATSQVRE